MKKPPRIRSKKAALAHCAAVPAGAPGGCAPALPLSRRASARRSCGVVGHWSDDLAELSRAVGAGASCEWRETACDIALEVLLPPAVRTARGARRSRRLRLVPPWAARRSAAALAVASLVGCAAWNDPGTAISASSTVQPVWRAQGVVTDAASAYAQGKRLLETGRPRLALRFFEQAEAARPGWSDAVNGRVVALVRLGEVDEAIEVAARAAQADPANAELRGNLGVLQLRAGRFEQARDSLQQAVSIDPANPAWRQWLALPSFSQFTAPTVAQPDAAGVGGTPVAAGALGAARAPGPAIEVLPQADQPATVKWVRHGPNVLELRRPPPPADATQARQEESGPGGATAMPASVEIRPVAARPSIETSSTRMAEVDLRLPSSAAAPVSPADRPPAANSSAGADATLPVRVVRAIEVSNGAGRPRLARQTAQALQQAGVTETARLSNHVHFRVRQTEIHYRDPSRFEAALALAHTLGLPVRLVADAGLDRRVDAKVVLGADAAERVARGEGLSLPARAMLALARPR